MTVVSFLPSQERVRAVFNNLDEALPNASQGLTVACPADGAMLALLPEDGLAQLAAAIAAANRAQSRFAALKRSSREVLLSGLAAEVKAKRESLAELILLEGGKVAAEGLGEADGSADILLKTIKDASFPEFGGMLRTKERPPVGLVGLITSFNFPLAVANWTIAPAMLAGNAVLWKPSEKTPLTALAYKYIFDQAMGEFADLLQILVGGRELGTAMVSAEEIRLISATGSVAMGRGIHMALAQKAQAPCPPILELGGNNGVIITAKMSEAHRDWAVACLLNSYFGTAGQRCTNTRRLIVHRSQVDAVVTEFKRHITQLVTSGSIASPLEGNSNAYGYGPLIDIHAFTLFEKAKQAAAEQGGIVWGGARLMANAAPEAYYVEPALAVMPSQTSIVHEETFAPLLYIIPYAGEVENALTLLNAPENAGLVSGIYTQSQREADIFAAGSEAGHVVINSAKGTGTPAFGMGFGGNKASGEGEILNAADPLRAFTLPTSYKRIAQNKDIAMDS